MESEALPLIDELAALESPAEVTAWLQACPLALFVSHVDVIHGELVRRGHASGIAYLAAASAYLSRTRKPGEGLSFPGHSFTGGGGGGDHAGDDLDGGLPLGGCWLDLGTCEGRGVARWPDL